jgi:hypothetical protein
VVKIISICLLCMLAVMLVPNVYAQSTESEVSSPGSFVLNRGIFGVVYKVIIGVGKTVEAVFFGRFGAAGLRDYFKTDRVFLKNEPKY